MSAKRLRELVDAVQVPRSDLQDVHRRAEVHGRATTRRRALGRSAAVALIALVLAVPLALLSPLGDDRGSKPRTDTAGLDSPLEGPGMRAELPTGWDGRMEYIAGGAPAFEGANFPLTGVPLIAHPTSAEQTIVAIVDWTATCPCPGFEPTSLPLSVDRTAFEARSDLPDELGASTPIPEGHDFVRLAFRIEQRYFTLLVEAGSRPITERSLFEVNTVLRSWAPTGSLEPSPSEGICPEGGPWIDPDCPEAQWVMRIVRRAGFRLEGDTGGAFTIRREGQALNIWQSSRSEEPVSPDDLRAEGYGPWIRVGDTQVFLAEDQATWIAGEANVWVSTYPGDQRPSADDVSALVEASLADPFAYGS